MGVNHNYAGPNASATHIKLEALAMLQQLFGPLEDYHEEYFVTGATMSLNEGSFVTGTTMSNCVGLV